MFGINKNEMENNQAEKEVTKLLAKMLSEVILESDAPETMKLGIRTLNKANDCHEAIHNLIDHYVDAEKRASAETLKTVLEYLELVEIGIKQFMESTPFVKDTEGDEK